MNKFARNRSLRLAAVILSFSAVLASAQELPLSVPIELEGAASLPEVEIVAPKLVCNSTPAARDLIARGEAFSDKVKPIRDVIGYVHAPQGLVIKLVNDHIFRIPAWIGYVADPIGSVKIRVIGEARTRVQAAVKKSFATPQDPVCSTTEPVAAETFEATLAPVEAV